MEVVHVIFLNYTMKLDEYFHQETCSTS